MLLLILVVALLCSGWCLLLHHHVYVLISGGHQQAVGRLEMLSMLNGLSVLFFTSCSSAILLSLLWNQFSLVLLPKLTIPVVGFELNFLSEAYGWDMLALIESVRLHGRFMNERTLLDPRLCDSACIFLLLSSLAGT